MVNDGFSESDQRPALADHIDRNSNDPLLGSPVSNLTQELAQLLAALIAQNQANFVSAAAARRTIPPASWEELSTLSYTQPAAARTRP